MSARIPPHRTFRLQDLVLRPPTPSLCPVGKILNSLHSLLCRISGIARGDMRQIHDLIQSLHRHIDTIADKQEMIRARTKKPACPIMGRLRHIREALKDLPRHEQEAILDELEMRVGIAYDPAA